MPNVEEDVIRLLYEVKGQQAIADAQKDVANYNRLVDALKDDLAAGAIKEDEFAAKARVLAAGAAEAAAKLGGLERAAAGVTVAAEKAAAAAEKAAARRAAADDRAADRQLAALRAIERETERAATAAERAADRQRRAADKATGGVAGMGQSFLQTGRVIQDFSQGGIAGVLNNIEGLTMALGMGQGLAGVLTIVGVGFYLLKPKIDEFLAALKPDQVKTFTSEIEKLKDRIKVLTEQPAKLAVDFRHLDEAQRRLDLLEAHLAAYNASIKTTDQEALGAEATGAVRDTIGSAELAKRLQAIRKDRPSAVPVSRDYDEVKNRLAEEQKELARLEKAAADPTYGGAGQAGAMIRREVSLKLQEHRTKVAATLAEFERKDADQVKNFIGALEKGEEDAIARFKGLAESNTAALGTDFSAAVIALPDTARGVRQRRKDALNIKRQQEDAKAKKAADAERKKKEADLDAELTRQGKDVEQEAVRDEAPELFKTPAQRRREADAARARAFKQRADQANRDRAQAARRQDAREKQGGLAARRQAGRGEEEGPAEGRAAVEDFGPAPGVDLGPAPEAAPRPAPRPRRVGPRRPRRGPAPVEAPAFEAPAFAPPAFTPPAFTPPGFAPPGFAPPDFEAPGGFDPFADADATLGGIFGGADATLRGIFGGAEADLQAAGFPDLAGPAPGPAGPRQTHAEKAAARKRALEEKRAARQGAIDDRNRARRKRLGLRDVEPVALGLDESGRLVLPGQGDRPPEAEPGMEPAEPAAIGQDQPGKAGKADAAAATTSKVLDNQEGLVGAVAANTDGLAMLGKKADDMGRKINNLSRAAHSVSTSLLSNGYDQI